jgi:hypothetical protein
MESFPRFSDWLENEGQAPDYSFDRFVKKASEEAGKLGSFVAKSEKEGEKIEKEIEKKKKEKDKKPAPPPPDESEEPDYENDGEPKKALETLKKIAKEKAEKAKEDGHGRQPREGQT